jgi:hypothetical protein
MVPRESVRNALGCLSTAPEPFADGGVFVSFCLSHAAIVRLEVFSTDGILQWRSEDQALAAGPQQWYFDGRTKDGPLEPGPYLYQVTADYGSGQKESRQGALTRGRHEHH